MSTDKPAAPSDKPAPNPADVLVGVVNQRACVFNLTWTVPAPHAPKTAKAKDVLVPREPRLAALLPGLNFVRKGDLDAARAEDESSLVVDVDPVKLHSSQAVKLASETSSMPALQRWLSMESPKRRKAVGAAIQRRMETMRGAPARRKSEDESEDTDGTED